MTRSRSNKGCQWRTSFSFVAILVVADQSAVPICEMNSVLSSTILFNVSRTFLMRSTTLKTRTTWILYQIFLDYVNSDDDFRIPPTTSPHEQIRTSLQLSNTLIMTREVRECLVQIIVDKCRIDHPSFDTTDSQLQYFQEQLHVDDQRRIETEHIFNFKLTCTTFWITSVIKTRHSTKTNIRTSWRILSCCASDSNKDVDLFDDSVDTSSCQYWT